MNPFRSALAALCLLGLGTLAGCRHTTRIFVNPYSSGQVSQKGDVLTWSPLTKKETPDFVIYVKVGACIEGEGADPKDPNEPGDTEKLKGTADQTVNCTLKAPGFPTFPYYIFFPSLSKAPPSALGGTPGLNGPYALHVGPCRNCNFIVGPDHSPTIAPVGDPDHFPVIACTAAGATGSIDLNPLLVKDGETVLWSNSNSFTIDFGNSAVCTGAKTNVPCKVTKQGTQSSYNYTARVQLSRDLKCTAQGALTVQ